MAALTYRKSLRHRSQSTIVLSRAAGVNIVYIVAKQEFTKFVQYGMKGIFRIIEIRDNSG